MSAAIFHLVHTPHTLATTSCGERKLLRGAPASFLGIPIACSREYHEDGQHIWYRGDTVGTHMLWSQEPKVELVNAV
jgi:hypothetical protein